MNFDFEDEVLVRKIQFYLLAIIVALLLINISLNFWRGDLYFVKPRFTEEKMMIEDICFHGIKSVLEKNPHPELLTEDNYKALLESKFTIFNYEDVHAFSKPRISGNTCYISAKDKKGLLAFKLTVKEIPENYGYVITDIEEVETSLFKGREE